MARHPLRPGQRRRTARRTSFARGAGWLALLAWLALLVLLGVLVWWGWDHWKPSPQVPTGRGRTVGTPPVPGVGQQPLLPSTPVPTNAVTGPTPLPVEEVPLPPVKEPEPEVVETPAPKPGPTNAPVSRIEVDLSGIPSRPPTNILEAQIALTAYGIGSGSIDGIGGAQTAWALRAFQFSRGLEETGRLDRDTQKELKFKRPLYRELTVAAEDLGGLAPVPSGWVEKAALPRLAHETLLERIAERTYTHPNFLRRLNPSINWIAVKSGTVLVVPNSQYPPARKAALVRISLANRYLRAFDGQGNLLAHFPCSIGRIAEKRPVGELQAAVVVRDPNYTFNPDVFPESPEARKIGRKLIIPPGPNNPVGVAWIGLNRPGYGIHGTPIPEQVGRTESHGCFRLANWNADYLRQMMAVGTPVWVEL